MDLHLSRSHTFALLGQHFGPAPPNQPPLPPDADWCGTARALPEQRGTFSGAGLRMCPTRGVSSPISPYGAPQGSPSLVQGRRWVVLAWKNQCEYDGGWSLSGPIFGRPGADQAPSSPGALHDINGAVRSSSCKQVHEARAFPRVQRNVDDSRGAAVVS